MVTGDAVIDLSNVTSISNLPPELAHQISSFIVFLQAIGGIFVLYLIFNLINTFLNRKKQKQFENMNKNLEEIKELLKEQKKTTKKKK